MFEFVSMEEWLKSSTDYFITTKENYPNQLPKRSTIKSAGYDFFSPFEFNLDKSIPLVQTFPHSFVMPTGIKWNPKDLNNDNLVLMLYPRSSLGFKNHFRFFNTVPIIDADYYNNPDNEGHILIGFEVSTTTHEFKLQRNDKICQGIIIQYYNYDNENNINLRTGGIGSTGK